LVTKLAKKYLLSQIEKMNFCLKYLILNKMSEFSLIAGKLVLKIKKGIISNNMKRCQNI